MIKKESIRNSYIKILEKVKSALPGSPSTTFLKSSFKSGAGFTLIELLIVIVIIGVLATILLANFIGVRQRSRDAQRKADLRQIQSAIELYKADRGVYPPALYFTDCPTSSSLIGGTVTYMQKIPCNPLPPTASIILGATVGNYYYFLSGNTYNLITCIENTNDTDRYAYTVSALFCPSRKVYQLTNP